MDHLRIWLGSPLADQVRRVFLRVNNLLNLFDLLLLVAARVLVFLRGRRHLEQGRALGLLAQFPSLMKHHRLLFKRVMERRSLQQGAAPWVLRGPVQFLGPQLYELKILSLQ